MNKTIKTALIEWNKTTTERQKLQHTYSAIALLAFIIAGAISLMNHALGQDVLIVAIIALIIIAINIVSWALLQSFVLIPLDKAASATATAPKKPAVKSTRKK